jgi:ABC-2 type transport system permease protein
VEEWLLTAPISPTQLVLGKYLGILAVALAIVAASGAFVAVLFRHGDPEPGPAWTGLGGLALAASALVSLGLATSAWSKSQGLAATAALVVGLGLFLLDAPARTAPEPIARLLQALALPARFEAMGRGLVTGVDLAYFLSLIAIGLFAARLALVSRRWS